MLLVLIIGGVLGSGLTWVILQQSSLVDERHENDGHEIHQHAAFHLYENSEKIDFFDMKYMHVEPCMIDGEETDHPHDSLEDQIHLHDRNGEVIHIHHTDLTWGDFFESINYEFSSEPIGYQNGKFIEDVLDRKIVNYERMILFTGEFGLAEDYYNNLPSLEEIEEVANSSESCGS